MELLRRPPICKADGEAMDADRVPLESSRFHVVESARHVQSDMELYRIGYVPPMTTLRDRFERGYGMRAQRIAEGALLIASIITGDLRPAYLAYAVLAVQMVSPYLAPIGLAWAVVEQRVPPDRLGNLYYDPAGSRGATIICCAALSVAFAMIRWMDLPRLGRLLLSLPAASCILAGTAGFCAGCGFYVLGRDLLVRAGLLRGTPKGACDVDIERR